MIIPNELPSPTPAYTASPERRKLTRFCGALRSSFCHAMPRARVLLVTASLFFSAATNADVWETSLEDLIPSDEQRQATAIISHLMQNYHYSRVELDDDLSVRIFERFLDSLDPQKLFFLASDVAEFDDFRLTVDDSLRQSRLDPVFEIFKRYRSRLEDRSEFALELLGKEFDFTIEEEYVFDREDAAWPESPEAADELWRKRVKNDLLNLRLADQSMEDAVETLQDRYQRMARRVSQLSANEVFEVFINAYTLSVEPHTAYFSPRGSENFNINMSLSLEGIGAALTTEGEYTVVQRVIAGGPAAMSEQLSADDRIVGVGEGDGEIVDVVSWPLDDVVDLIRGPKGSTVQLKILSANAAEGSPPSVITLIRDKIKLEEQAAKSSVIELSRDGKLQRFGVIDLPTFYLDSLAMSQRKPDYRSTTRDVQRLLDELKGTDGGVDGIIMDLRGNGGGSLFEAVKLTGLFIKSGPVVQIRDANGDIGAEADEDPNVAYDGPLAVLVDRNSASASEIFAAAIQDYGRGVVLGEPTFGKGTVQTVAPLDRDGELGQLKITTAQFFRVSGDGTQHRGVIPDVLFPTAMGSDAQGERGLDNALPWAEITAANFDSWATEQADDAQLQALHEERYRGNESFSLLIDELEAQREARSKRSVSLVEEVRKQEILEREKDREVRLELYRKAFGVSSAEDDQSGVADILLEEAANVLYDFITFKSE